MKRVEFAAFSEIISWICSQFWHKDILFNLFYLDTTPRETPQSLFSCFKVNMTSQDAKVRMD